MGIGFLGIGPLRLDDRESGVSRVGAGGPGKGNAMIRRQGRKEVSPTLILLVLGSSLVSVGCVTVMPPTERLEVSTDRQYQDIPVPFEFEYDRQKSWAYTRFEDKPLNLRSCVLVYWGDSPVRQVREWYLDQMPKHDWVFEETMRKSQSQRMIFSKGSEIAKIDVRRMPTGVGQERVTRVMADIGLR